MKKLLALIITMSVCFMTSVISFAEETYTTSTLVQPRGASGSASLQTNKQWSFTVPVKGYSYIAHAKIIVHGIPSSDQTVTIFITKPDGNSIFPLSSVTLKNQTFYQNFYNAGAGNYTVLVRPLESSFWFTTIVEILDGVAPR